ncbi:MAG TPA: alpha/beta fold hydrolase [Mycobacterium sp.]|nr:alpha/beta fold hydrolase [Mycobacterium sp.]
MIARVLKSLSLCGLLVFSFGARAQAQTGDLALQISGHGPVVVLESGLGAPQSNWSSVVPPLARCLTVVTYDRRGIGESPPRSDPFAPVLAEDVANDLSDALRAYGLRGPYLLVGHSIGGLYVQAFARAHPERVSGMVLVDASSPLEPPGVFVSSAASPRGSIEAAEEAGVAASVARLMSGPPLPPMPLVVLAAANHGDAAEREELWRDVQRRTAALSPNGRFELVESRHFIQIDRPEVVVAAVLDVASRGGVNTSDCKSG